MSQPPVTVLPIVVRRAMTLSYLQVADRRYVLTEPLDLEAGDQVTYEIDGDEARVTATRTRSARLLGRT